MKIRIIEGMDAGRAHIARLRDPQGTVLPKRVADRLHVLFGRPLSAEEAVAQIVTDVRRDGDTALKDYSRRIDGHSLDSFWVDASTLEAAYRSLPVDLREALRLAADRIRSFHQREPRHSWLEWDDEGGALGQMIRPLQRVGVYVPGGTASYPSSLLMAAIPAQVAGVPEILATTPPFDLDQALDQAEGGAVILAAAHIIGLERVLLLGGAQAIAALAYGTASVPRVDKVVGAGGLFVTLAKKQVYGDVGIEGLHGPTETLIIADDSASPALIAADLLAQAEHDPLATALLITPSLHIAEAVRTHVVDQLRDLARRAIIEESLAGQGAILVIDSLDQAFELANEYAPEHLCLLIADPWPSVARIHNAGGIFVGEGSSEALGDYVVGPSHVMPTRGTARFSSPLHVRDFVKVTSIFAVDNPSAQRLAPAAQQIAAAEGLTAHAAAVIARQE
ncbi:MAG: histidinol dehydrogenase [Anaerolineae bacterium]